jgi:hypothetical protein
MLHLVAAFAHVAAGRSDAADDRLSEAVELARHTGDGAACGLWFGPTNVGAWRVALAVERGEAGAVAEIAAQINDALLPPFRRASLLADVGRGLAREPGRQDEAVEAFLRAEAIAAHQLHADPYARETIASMLTTARSTKGNNLLRSSTRGPCYAAKSGRWFAYGHESGSSDRLPAMHAMRPLPERQR